MITLNTTKWIYNISILLFCLNLNAQECNTIIDVNFNNWNNQKYSIRNIKQDFDNKVKPWTASTYRGVEGPGASNNLIEDTPQETRIVNGTLRAEYLKNDASGRSGGFLFDPYFDGVEEAYLEYKLKFDNNFFWATGGKLPGLGGSTEGINSETQGRGTIPSGKRYNESGTGFSARLMWRRNRAQTDKPYLILYSYFAKKQDNTTRRDNQNGDAYRLISDIKDNKWYTIKQYIKLNTPGRDDGTVKMWIDGELVMNNTEMNIRKTTNRNLKINALIMNTYRGGSRTDPVWQSSRTEYTFFDDFKVWTNCSEIGATNDNNEKPTIVINKPLNNSVFELGETIELNASASDPDGNLEKVNFKINDDFYRQDQTRPFKTTFTPQREGTYVISAKAFDTKGLSFEKSVTITFVTPTPVNQRPTVTINRPLNNSVFELGQAIVLDVSASDPNGNLEKVNFKINDDFYRQDRTRPFKTTFTPQREGTYVISAKAFDTEGLSFEKSVSVTIIENSDNELSTNNDITTCNFNMLANRRLPSFNRASFNDIHVLGNGGPSLNQIRAFKINWDASTNKLYQFAINTKNGIPAYYVNLLDKISFNFNSINPEITVNNSGLSGWDGSYWVINDGNNFVMISKNENYSIYFTNGSAPSCEEIASKNLQNNTSRTTIKLFPSPTKNVINLTGLSKSTYATIIDITGKIVINNYLNSDNPKIEVSKLLNGIYFLKIDKQLSQKTLPFIKN